jgi:hypothetical protein
VAIKPLWRHIKEARERKAKITRRKISDMSEPAYTGVVEQLDGGLDEIFESIDAKPPRFGLEPF